MSTQLPRDAKASDTSRATDLWPVLLCWVAVALDGFDLVVLGAVIPTLLGDRGPRLHRRRRSPLVATVGLIGVGIGAVLIGPLDRPVRPAHARLITLHRGVLGVHAAGRVRAQTSPRSPSLRFLAGLGLGACLPTALAFMTEHAPPGRGGSAVTRMMTGYHVGAVLTALLALLAGRRPRLAGRCS